MQPVRTATRLATSLSVLALLFGAVGCGSDDEADSGAATQEGQKTLKVGTTLELPPVQYADASGKPTGFEYEMVKAVTDKLGYKLEIVQTPFPQAFVGLLAKKYDMFFSATYITCERIQGAEGAVSFSVPVWSESHVIAADADVAPNLKSLDDVDGMTVGIESKGGTADALSTAYLKENPDAFKKQIFANVNDLLLARQQGRVDAAFAATITLLWGTKDDPKTKVGPPVPDTTFPAGWVFRSGDGDALRAEFDKAIQELQEDGTLARIWEKWLVQPPTAENPVARPAPAVTDETCISRG